MTADLLADDWVPSACTLPAVEQPLRGAELEKLFANDVLALHRETPLRVRLELRPDPEAVSRAAGLAVKETGCCSFFVFDLFIADGTVSLGIETGASHEGVLTALAARAEAQLGAAL